MAATVARQKYHLGALEPADQQGIRGVTPGGFDFLPNGIREALDIIQAGAADNANNRRYCFRI
jgi:hypothetical protein